MNKRDVKGLVIRKKPVPSTKEGKFIIQSKEDVEFKNVTADYEVTQKEIALQGIKLAPRQAEHMTLIFRSNDTVKASYEVNVIQRVGGKEVGGIKFIVRTGFGKEK